MSPLENDTTMMDHFHFSGVFHNVKINVSTRMTPVHLKFTVQAQTQRNGTLLILCALFSLSLSLSLSVCVCYISLSADLHIELASAVADSAAQAR
jgi:hypothetical protein